MYDLGGLIKGKSAMRSCPCHPSPVTRRLDLLDILNEKSPPDIWRAFCKCIEDAYFINSQLVAAELAVVSALN